MKKTQKLFVVSWMLVMVMVLNIFPIGLAFAEDLSPSVLTNFTATITQDGATIPEGGTVTSTKPIRVAISFGVPVVGDDPTPATPVQKGDTVTFALSDAFNVVSGLPIELKMGATLVGHATFSTDPDTKMVTVTIIFDGDIEVFDGTSNTVTVQFGAEFEYGDSEDDSTGNHTVTILGKTYIVNVPALPIVYDVTKTGAVNLADQSITWTVSLKATQGNTNIDLEGYRFVDDLESVGEYIPDSFQLDSVDVTPDLIDSVLNYVFPENSTSPKTITFKTAISDSSYYATSQQNVTNNAQFLNSESAVMDQGQAQVSFTPRWIEKAGVSSDSGSTGIYDPTNRTITWTITANHMGATLNNVVITDVLPNTLNLQSASWQTWTGSSWDTATSITPNANSEYAIGNINAMILLTIVSSVPDDQYTTGRSTYSNSASIRWDGLQGSGLGSGSINVGVGFNAITKSGVANTISQKIRWTVNVDTRGQDIPSLKVYDLFVYGSSINLSTVSGIPSGMTFSDLTPRYGQTYTGNFVGSYTVNVIPIMQGSNRVADLLEISGLSTINSNTFSFESKILDPNIFAGNRTSTVRNTATLFSANSRLNAATGSVNYTNRMLLKGMLNRQAIVDPAASVNSSLTSNANEGFDYQDKSAIFRLSINADGIDLTNAEIINGQILGQTTLTETLPAGWEFVDIIPGSKYLIFEGTGQSNGVVWATDTTPDTITGFDGDFSLNGTATFSFTALDKPYVILVKAKPTSETIAEYFGSNKTTTVRNNAILKTENWITGVTHYQDITIVSQILGKNATQPKAGELRWTVDYKPYGVSQTGEKLEDHLPVGIDLRMDASGSLEIADNITVNELILNSDGSHTVGSPVELVLETNVSYDNTTRVLSFIIPDSKQAYRFSYLTDITGEPGTITNNVFLLGGSTELEGTSKVYQISASDGSASLLKNGWISITKTNGQGPLAGAEFTLYSKDGTTVIRKGITGNDGIVKLKVIPDGEYIFRETIAPTGYSLEGVNHSLLVSTNGSTVTASIDGKTGTNANTITVLNYSVGTTGNLTISKSVVGDGADTTKSFIFTLILNGAIGPYTYFGHGLPGGTITSGDTISLTHGQSITITGLPAGATYTVTEDEYADEGYTTTNSVATGNIEADKTLILSFTNVRAVGSLIISKTVTGNSGDVEKKFNFNLLLNGIGAAGTYSYTGNGVSDGMIRSGDTFTLSHGQSITILGLPAGMQYNVTEADYSEAGYTTISTGAIGTISGGTTQTASFINRYGNGENIGDGEGGGMPPTGDYQADGLARLGMIFFTLALMALIAADFALHKKYLTQESQK